ncbi:MAG: hypothetical protein ACTSUV_05265 [Candidatus Ranarchaeia archaeon]
MSQPPSIEKISFVLSDLKARISQIEQEVIALKNKVNGIVGELDNLSNSMVSISSILSDVHSNVENLKGSGAPVAASPEVKPTVEPEKVEAPVHIQPVTPAQPQLQPQPQPQPEPVKEVHKEKEDEKQESPFSTKVSPTSKVRRGIIPPSSREDGGEPASFVPPAPASGSIPPPPPAPATLVSSQTATTDAAKLLINDLFGGIKKKAQEGVSCSVIGQLIVEARDRIQEKVSVSPAFHEMASYSRTLKAEGENKITDTVFEELINKLENWKVRLRK